MIRHPDILSGFALIAAGAVMTYLSWQIETVPYEVLTARFFPVMASIGLALCGVGLMIKGVVAARKTLPNFSDRRVVGLIVVFLLYFFTFTIVDFRLSTWALMLASMYLLGARSRNQLVVTPIAVSLITFVIFRYGFEILLPQWI